MKVMGKRTSALALASALLLAAAPAFAQGPFASSAWSKGAMTNSGAPAGVTPNELKKVDFEQRLDAQVPLDLPFKDEQGRPVQLATLFHGRPVILTLVYYDCPMLCTQVLTDEVSALRLLSLEPGKDFDLITVSFNPRNTPADAAAKKKIYVDQYRRDGAANAWHFLTGTQPAIDVITSTVGFHYVYDQISRQYAHPTGIMVLTPQGRVAKDLYGLEYSARDLRLALVEAASGKIGTPVDKLLLYCYHYDPRSGKYGLVVMNVLRLAGVLTLVVLGGLLFILFRGEKKQGQAAWPAAEHPPGAKP